jgi:hypothetical protein
VRDLFLVDPAGPRGNCPAFPSDFFGLITALLLFSRSAVELLFYATQIPLVATTAEQSSSTSVLLADRAHSPLLVQLAPLVFDIHQLSARLDNAETIKKSHQSPQRKLPKARRSSAAQNPSSRRNRMPRFCVSSLIELPSIAPNAARDQGTAGGQTAVPPEFIRNHEAF